MGQSIWNSTFVVVLLCSQFKLFSRNFADCIRYCNVIEWFFPSCTKNLLDLWYTGILLLLKVELLCTEINTKFLLTQVGAFLIMSWFTIPEDVVGLLSSLGNEYNKDISGMYNTLIYIMLLWFVILSSQYCSCRLQSRTTIWLQSSKLDFEYLV